MFGFGRSRELDDFATGLAREFIGLIPPGADLPAAQKVAKAVDQVCNRAKSYYREHSLGIYGRARVGTAFKLELKHAGYSDEFVNDLTRQLLFIMSGK
ncbi:MAG: hypothetical protein ACRET8_12575 [Burkholderiales bacterium]